MTSIYLFQYIALNVPIWNIFLFNTMTTIQVIYGLHILTRWDRVCHIWSKLLKIFFIDIKNKGYFNKNNNYLTKDSTLFIQK